MTIDVKTRAMIRKLWFSDGWSVGRIAKHLDIHHSTVKRAIEGRGKLTKLPRRKLIDSFVAHIKEELETYPDLPASTLWQSLVTRGFRGSEDHFRHCLRDLELRPVKRPEPAMRLRFLPAEQAQVDWVTLGKVQIGSATHRLMGFVMTLSYSRMCFLSLFYNERMNSFLQGHVEAFAAFGGVPRTVLYDNLKTAVTDRQGTAVRYNDTLLELAAHYAFEPRATFPRRPQEKGRVERLIRFVRTRFLAGRDITVSLDTLNAEAHAWSLEEAPNRPWPDNKEQTVRDAFHEERQSLTPLPEDPFPCAEMRPVRIDKTCYARFETNDYSVPPEYVKAQLTLSVTRNTLRVLDGLKEVAHHRRCYDRQQTISDPEHVRAITAGKRRARAMSVRHRLLQAVPRAEEMLTLAGQRRANVAHTTKTLTTLLDTYGADALDSAIATALERNSVHPNTVRRILEQNHAAKGGPPIPVADTHQTATPRGTQLDSYNGKE